MRQVFSRWPIAATAVPAIGPAPENNPPGSSVAATSSTTEIFPSGIKSLYNPEHATVDIVFIHGLTGHREKTWTARGASEPWPKVLLPSELPSARVLTFGYDANVVDWSGVVSQSRIGDHAWNLLTSLAAHREKDETNERPIIFVCHNLGGLVCKDALTAARQRVEKHLQNIIQLTVGIAFLGTPHHGAGLARWAELLSRHIGIVKDTNTEIVSVLRQDSEVLARIQEGFHTMIRARSEEAQAPIHITCFFEELPLPGVGQVVPQHSAILPGYIPIGIHSNHMDMVRFSSAEDPGFTAVCGELRRWILQIGAAKERHQNRSASNHTQPSGNGRNGQPNSTSHFIVPYTNNPDFVGRSEILRQLRSKLLHDQDSPDGTSQPRASLYGLGGIGKTQIALAYVFWLHQKHPDISVFWIHASNAERFRQGYASIAQECQIPGYDDPKTDVLPLVKKWLERKDGSQWLMVIDNADDMQVFFGKQTEPVDDSLSGRMGTVGRYIPDCPHGAILVTTRNLQAGSRLIKGKQPIKVEELNDEETVQLLRTRLDGIDATPSDFSALSSRLEHLPLALVQGAAFIQENGLTIDEYFRLLDNSDQHLVDLLSEEFETEGRDSETPRAVAETWILSFEQIQRQNALAAKLLSLMSLLDRQAIPMEFLSQYSEQKGEEQWSGMELTKAVGVLKAFCFIVGDEGRGFDIHRLVQLVTQKWLRRKDMMQSFATQALLVVSQAYPYGNYENWAICNAYLPHATAVLSLGDSGTNEQSMARASLLYCVAGFFYYKGRWKDAGTLFKQATDIQKGVLGEEHPETLSSIADLAAAYWNQGRWKEAENLEVQVIETRKRVLGEEHPDTLSSISALALTYQRQGRWREAENLAAPVMETRKKVLGEEHPDTLTSMDGVAWTYRSQGRLKEAEDLEMQVMETRKRVLGEEHPDTLISMGNLAEAYQDRGRWKEAVDLAVQVMETRKRVLGEEHPDTLTSMANLAVVYSCQGRWKEAENLEVQVMETRKRLLGEEHPDTLTGMANLAVAYANQGRWKEAEDLEVQMVEMRKKVLGEEHPETLTSVANLGMTYHNQGRWKEAEDLGLRVIEVRRRVLGKEHPDTLTSIANLAATYRSQYRWKEAVDLEVQVMEARKRVLGEEHPDTLTSVANLASTYYSQGRWKEAIELQLQVVEMRKTVLGEEHPDTLVSVSSLALMYSSQDQWKEAEDLEMQVMETRKRVLGEEHPDTLTSMANLALTYNSQGLWKEAEDLGVQVMEVRKRVLGEEHPDTLTSMANLALTYCGQGRLKEAGSLQLQVIGMRKRVLGEEHPETLDEMTNLALTYRSQGRRKEAKDLEAQVKETRKRVRGEERLDMMLTNTSSLIPSGVKAVLAKLWS